MSRATLKAPRIGRIPDADLAGHEEMLLEAARRLFYKHGFDGTSIDAVAREAHVSPKTIYGRFGGKSGLFFEVMRGKGDILTAPLNALAGELDEVRAVLVEFATNLLTLVTQPEAITIQRTIIAQAEKFPELAATFHANGPKRGIATVAAFLGRAASAGILDIEDPAVAADFLVGALISIPMREGLFLGKRTTRPAIVKRARELVRVFLRAYRPD